MISDNVEMVNFEEDFRSGLKSALRAVQDARAHLETLAGGSRREPEKGTADHAKWIFVRSQVDTVSRIVQLFVAQNAKLEYDPFLFPGERRDEERKQEFYRKAAEFLESMQIAVRRAVGLPPTKFEHVMETITQLVQKPHSRLGMFLGAFLGASFLGGLPKAVFGTLAFTPGLGIKAAAVGVLGTYGAISAGLVSGAVIGCLIAAGIDWAVRQWTDGPDESEQLAIERRKKMQELMEKLEKSPLTEEYLSQALREFEEFFVKVMEPAVNEWECLICLEGFPADGGARCERPCRASNCRSDHHLCHQQCLNEWQLKRGDFTCVLCRQ
mmetsp:Transcript_16014/g.36695  ORF Transcript_16014/g.36695 Transcript_16014/m.36695 type:complete len:326 (-) Transcript_16014:347-1324(-)